MMPQSKMSKKRRFLATLHERVSKLSGFRPVNLLPGENPTDVANGLRELESRGMVMFLTGTGWIDTEPAIRRYKASRKVVVHATNSTECDIQVPDGDDDFWQDLKNSR